MFRTDNRSKFIGGPEYCAQIKKQKQQRIEIIEMKFLQVDTQLSN